MNDENNVQTNEVANETIDSGAQNGRLTDKGREFDNLKKDVNEIKDKYDIKENKNQKNNEGEKNVKSMREVCDETDRIVSNMENELFNEYCKALPDKVTNYDDLTDEQKADYDKYKAENLPSLTQKVFKDAKDNVMRVSKERWKALEAKEKEAIDFKDSLDGEITDRENEIATLMEDDPIKNKAEIDRLNAEIAEIRAVKDKVDGELIGTIYKAKDYQKTINNYAIGRLAKAFETYPEIDVMGDADLANINKDYDEKESQEKNDVTNEAPTIKDEQEQSQPNQENTSNSTSKEEKEGKDGKKAGNVPVEGNQIQMTPQALALGVVPNMNLTYASSWALLGRFTAADLTNEERLAMLNDPECKTQLLTAMKIAGGVKNPFKARQYRGIRDQVLELAKGPMMEMALKEYGIDSPDNVAENFKMLKEQYIKERAEATTNEDIQKVNEKYDTMFNVDDFQLSSKKLKTLRTRFKDFVSYFTNEEKRQQLGEAIDRKMFVPKEDKETDEHKTEEVEKDTPEVKEAEEHNVEVKASDYIAPKIEEKETKSDKSANKETRFMQGSGVNKMSVEQAKKIVEREEKEEAAKTDITVDKEIESK